MNEWQKKREQIQGLEAPKELEDRLYQALESKKHKKRWPVATVTAAALLFLVMAMNYQVLAFYGQQFFGYDALMSESLSKWNEEQKGQAVNQSIELADGTVVTIDGVISDINRFHVYYRLENQRGVNEDLRLTQVTGFLTDEYRSSGTYEMNEAGTEIVGIQAFDAVSPFAKKLTVHIEGLIKEEEMTIPYNASAAVPTMLKTKLNKTVAYDYGELRFKEIRATQASTVITGSFTKEDERNFSMVFSGIQLIADGKVLGHLQSGSHSDIWGRGFELMYEAIPDGTKQLALRMDTFNGYMRVDVDVALDGKINVGDSWIDVLDTKQQDNKTYVTIVSEMGMYLDDVALLTAQGVVPLETIHANDFADEWERTLLFDTTETIQSLRVGGVYYLKKYNETIEVDF